jgi:hypothetical protein
VAAWAVRLVLGVQLIMSLTQMSKISS